MIRTAGTAAIAAMAMLLAGCAGRGLVSRHYDAEFYRVEQLLASDIANRNPKFLVYGDNQGCFRVVEDFAKRHNWWTWKQALIPFYQIYWLSNGVVGAVNAARTSADGGKETRLMMRDEMYRAAVESHADFILNVGDICTHDGRRPAHWRKFLMENRVNSPLLKDVAYLPTAGNHERTSDDRWGRPNYEAVFNREPFYSVEFRDADLFVIDSEVICDLYQDMDDSEQDRRFEEWFVSADSSSPAWLERELAACGKRFKIISMHIPPINFGRHFRDWTGEGDYGIGVPEKRRQLLELFHRYGVQLVFSGHEHIYQHNILHFDDNENGAAADLHVVVSSGGGVPLRHLPDGESFEEQRRYYLDHDYDVENVMLGKFFHYCEVEIDSLAITVRTYAVSEDEPERHTLAETITIHGD